MPGYAPSRARWIVAGILGLLLVVAVAGCAQPAQSMQPAPAAKLSANEPAIAVPPSPPTASAVLSAQPPFGTLAPLPATMTPTPMPSPTPSPRPSPDPLPTTTPTLRQLTQGGCCTQPFWSPDSRQVLFIDKPTADAPVGIWGVDVTQPTAKPQLATPRIAFYTPDMEFVVELSRTTTTVERLTAPLTGTVAARWTVPAGGRTVNISPGHTRIAWQAGDDRLISEPERQVNQIWVANLDGSAARPVITLPRGGIGGWISDDVLLLSGRESTQAREQVWWAFSLTTGQKTELARGERLRGGLLSPDGTWLAYLVALDKDQPRNGLWVVRTDGSAQHRLNADLFGAFQWRDGHRLLIVPFRPEASSHEFMEFDANTEQVRRLTDPTVTSLKIANGDWVVSPDGRHVVFVASQDHNLWLLALPD